ncbi:hypothetical protein BH23ACT2_BH23ACT2_25230 [soil metagenome]
MAKRYAPSDPPVARRSWPQRIVLGFGTILSVGAVVAASIAGWMAYQWQTVERTGVDLDAAVGGPANYLLVGSDTRSDGDPLVGGGPDPRAALADTIMVVRVDPDTREAMVLSLPRDLWVTLPGGTEGRINAAYADGPQALVDTVRDELDIPINHYLEVDFTGFSDAVSAIDGVPMWFDRPMRDANSGLDVAEPGCVTLDGSDALAFARARHLQYFEDGGFTFDGTGDLGRISRQQLFVRRVIDRATDQGLANPATLKRLVEVGTDNVTLDDGLSIGQLLALGRQFADYDGEALRTYTLPNTPRTTSGGAEIVDLEEADAAPILELFRPPPEPGDAPEVAMVSPADVDVTVLNSSGEQGLAMAVADDLVAAGFGVDDIGNGDRLGHATETGTVVRYGVGGETQANTVAAGLDGAARLEADPDLEAGVVVLFLGQDFNGLAAPATGESTATEVAPTSTTMSAPTSGAPVSTTAPIDSPVESPSDASPIDQAERPAETEVVGLIPGDPPPGTSCG